MAGAARARGQGGHSLNPAAGGGREPIEPVGKMGRTARLTFATGAPRGWFPEGTVGQDRRVTRPRNQVPLAPEA